MTPEALLADILANPEDDTPCLVSADWLEDHGAPERAEFVRLQVELAHLHDYHPSRPPLLRRQAALLEANAEAWLARVPAWARKKAEFRRGVVAHFELPASQLLRRGAGLRKKAPFNSLDLRDTPPLVAEVTASGLLEGVRHLELARG